jgi:hypothetical protein
MTQRKRCNKCACCKRECAVCPPPPSEAAQNLRVNDAAHAHSQIHMEFAQEAQAAGNVALAHNEAAQSAYGADVSEEYAKKVEKEAAEACCMKEQCDRPATCRAKRLQSMADFARANADSARANANLARSTANFGGPNPGIPGTPNAPSPQGYPGGPNPFATGRTTI